MDSNGYQNDGAINNKMMFEQLKSKWKGFGWNTVSCNGHDIEELLSSEGIFWDGIMTSDFYGEKFIMISFELESEQNLDSDITFNFNNYTTPVLQTECNEGFFFSNSDSELSSSCNILNENFEYIVPITFQGSGYLMPFNILIINTYIY